MEDHITLLPYILYIQGETTQREPTQRERVYGTKPPISKTWSAWNHPDSGQNVNWPSEKACYATSALLKSSSFLNVMCLNYIYNEICIVVLHANFILAISF